MKIYNTLTRKKEVLKTRRPGEVLLYVCGATVYDHCHIGHARSAIIFDVIRHYLEYQGFRVRYIKNYTDIDDKIIARAEKEGRNWREVADQFIEAYEHDMARLGVRPPTLSPKATDHISEMIQLIEDLISKGVAYAVEGDVYFEVGQFEAYGKLSHRKTDDLLAGARVEIDPRKRNPLDFALWKNSKPGEPTWKSPWGLGRPGWHIECSAMVMKHLGKSIDLHGGGEDLIFPHHENEVAQSEAITGQAFSSCWMHHSFVTIDREKMSKSLGNFFTVNEIFQKSSQFPESVIGEVLRFYLLATHYRSPIDFSSESLKMAKSGLDNFYVLFQKIDEIDAVTDPDETDEDLKQFQSDFEAAMNDDFNTAKAIGILQEIRAASNQSLKKGNLQTVLSAGKMLRKIGEILGFFRVSSKDWRYQPWDITVKHSKESTHSAKLSFSGDLQVKVIKNPLSGRVAMGGSGSSLSEESIQSLVKEREAARLNKNWAKSDEIRDQLVKAGIMIEDRPDGTTRIKR